MKKNNNNTKNSKTISEKKINKEMQTLKIAMISIISFIVLVFVILILRKMFIINNLKSSVKQYTYKDNIYAKICNYSDHLTIDQIFLKDNKTFIKHNIYGENSQSSMIISKSEKETDIFLDTGITKIATLNADYNTEFSVIEYLNELSVKDYLSLIIFSNVTKEYCNGSECYKISNIPEYIDSEIATNKNIYFDKNTGLVTRSISKSNPNLNINKDYVTDYEYKFDIVKDEDMVSPNIEDYEIQNDK